MLWDRNKGQSHSLPKVCHDVVKLPGSSKTAVSLTPCSSWVRYDNTASATHKLLVIWDMMRVPAQKKDSITNLLLVTGYDVMWCDCLVDMNSSITHSLFIIGLRCDESVWQKKSLTGLIMRGNVMRTLPAGKKGRVSLAIGHRWNIRGCLV